VTTIRQRILFLAAVLAFFSPALRSEQPQKASRTTPEDRLKKLEERADAAEKAASSAVMEKDYITRTQKQYEFLLPKSLQHANVDTGNHGTAPGRRVCPCCQIQPENDRRTDKNRYGRSHGSNAQRIRTGFSQGSPENFGIPMRPMSRI